MGRKVNQAAEGGWIPVINYHSRQGGTSINQSLVTLFVDNLPEDTSQSWLKMMFNKYGVVKDVFIPEKRSKVTGNKFGFIRYDYPVSADLAVLKANGLWLDDKKLFGKIASFGVKGKMPNSIRERVNCSGALRQTKVVKSDTDSSKEGINRNGSHKDFFVNNGRSYAQVLYGDKFPINNDTKAKATTRISVNEVDSEWLSKSVVAKLKPLSALESIREAIHCSGVPVLEVKDMGRLWVVVTFPSSEQMLSIFDGELSWLNNLFDEVKNLDSSKVDSPVKMNNSKLTQSMRPILGVT
ncbi:hypothetical protein Vadar_010794 [Vaccinium darrowii]|uniref:Uncharacterized protein n=1 Tax=Vaccinium darrowii TaxID=229202 RepID=A0ACB7ZI93_9ERIC|nr:hypothetical protein Vadar_010794 [Vaccinium darrowii]